MLFPWKQVLNQPNSVLYNTMDPEVTVFKVSAFFGIVSEQQYLNCLLYFVCYHFPSPGKTKIKSITLHSPQAFEASSEGTVFAAASFPLSH